MIIIINPIEIASNLAHEALINYVGRVILTEDRDKIEDVIFIEKNKELNYKEEYQELFNNYYDEYFEQLTENTVKGITLTEYAVKNILEVNEEEVSTVLEHLYKSKLAKISLTRIILEIGTKLGFKTK